MVELLNDGRVLQAYPKELYEKLDVMTTQIQKLTTQLSAKDEKITTLMKTITQLELKIDGQEQCSRRPNLRIQGLQDDARGEDVDKKVLTMINERIGFNPPLTCTVIERSHRLGRAAPGHARPRGTPCIAAEAR